jgi:hypothetical protein
VKAVRSSSAVHKLGSNESRASPVLEVKSTANGKPMRLGIDSMASIGCIGRSDLNTGELSLAVPTTESLHHAGGESLRSGSEVTFNIGIGSGFFDVTFNVIENGHFPLGFLLGMNVLEKHDFVLHTATRLIDYSPVALSKEKLQAMCAAREQQITGSVGVRKVSCAVEPLDDDDLDEYRRPQGLSLPAHHLFRHFSKCPCLLEAHAEGGFSCCGQ